MNADKSPDELIELARGLYRQWRLNEAQAVLEKLLEAPAKHKVTALNLYSDVMWSLGDKAAAQSATTELLEIDPLNPVATRRAQWLGIALDPRRYTDSWISDIIGSSKKLSTYPIMARLLNEVGHHDKALTVAKNGTALANKQMPADPRMKAKLLIETAMSLEHLGHITEAISVLDSVDPELPAKKAAALSKAQGLSRSLRYHYMWCIIDK